MAASSGPSQPNEVLIHLQAFSRSLRALLGQVESSLSNPEDDSYYRAVLQAYEAMTVLQRRTEWFAEQARIQRNGRRNF